ncbi:MAG: ABC transporter permease subunit, partial [Candidatus Binataceae bacterium]
MATSPITMRRALNGILSFIALAGLIALFFAFRHHGVQLRGPRISASIRRLPYYAFCSFYRMLAAYLLALGFSLVYGMSAARGRAYERVMLPVIDIAQSVPVVGFFPAAIYFFIALSHGSRLGVELAAIFLIFTSMAWNMALGVFESVRTIPGDSLEALDAFGASGWLKLKRLWLPAAVPKLVYNSILSWVAGWYYLIACEIITVGPAHYQLPGLGSYLMRAADRGRSGELVAGLALLLAIIVAMDVIVWQPLSVWAEKFRYEFAATSEPIRSLGMLGALSGIGPAMTRAIRAGFRPLWRVSHWLLASTPPFNPARHPTVKRLFKTMRTLLMLSVIILLAYGVVAGLIALAHELLRPWPAAARQIPAATGASVLRMIAAYLLSLAWT